MVKNAGHIFIVKDIYIIVIQRTTEDVQNAPKIHLMLKTWRV
jgi:hypothetical protein